MKIENHRDAQQKPYDQTDERPFVHVSVDNVGSTPQRCEQNCPKQQQIEPDFVWGRPDHIILTEWDTRRSPDRQICDILTIPIGTNGHFMAQSLKRPCLLQDSDRASIIGEKGSWGDHQDTVCACTGRFLLSHCQPVCSLQ